MQYIFPLKWNLTFSHPRLKGRAVMKCHMILHWTLMFEDGFERDQERTPTFEPSHFPGSFATDINMLFSHSRWSIFHTQRQKITLNGFSHKCSQYLRTFVILLYLLSRDTVTIYMYNLKSTYTLLTRNVKGMTTQLSYQSDRELFPSLRKTLIDWQNENYLSHNSQ